MADVRTFQLLPSMSPLVSNVPWLVPDETLLSLNSLAFHVVQAFQG